MLTKAEMRAAYEADKAAMTHEEMIAWHVAHAEISEEEQRSKSQIAAFHDVLCYIEEYDDAKAFIPAGFKELEDMTLLDCEDAYRLAHDKAHDSRTAEDNEFMYWYCESAAFSFVNYAHMLVRVKQEQAQ